MRIFILGVCFILIWVFVVGTISGFCWTYGLNVWLTHFSKPTINLFWTGFIIGVLPGIGQAGIPFAGITFISQLFM